MSCGRRPWPEPELGLLCFYRLAWEHLGILLGELVEVSRERTDTDPDLDKQTKMKTCLFEFNVLALFSPLVIYDKIPKIFCGDSMEEK